MDIKIKKITNKWWAGNFQFTPSQNVNLYLLFRYIMNVQLGTLVFNRTDRNENTDHNIIKSF